MAKLIIQRESVASKGLKLIGFGISEHEIRETLHLLRRHLNGYLDKKVMSRFHEVRFRSGAGIRDASGSTEFDRNRNRVDSTSSILIFPCVDSANRRGLCLPTSESNRIDCMLLRFGAIVNARNRLRIAPIRRLRKNITYKAASEKLNRRDIRCICYFKK